MSGFAEDIIARPLPSENGSESRVLQSKCKPGEQTLVRPDGGTDHREQGVHRYSVLGTKIYGYFEETKGYRGVLGVKHDRMAHVRYGNSVSDCR